MELIYTQITIIDRGIALFKAATNGRKESKLNHKKRSDIW